MAIRMLLTSIVMGLAAHVAAAEGPPAKRMADGKEWTTRNVDADVTPSFCYDGIADNCQKYGRLYPWTSAQRACLALGDRWRLPSNDEWRALGVAYGGLREDTADKGRAAYDALIAGGSSGFDIVFGGGHGFYWTATESGPETAWMYNFGRNGMSMNRHADAEKPEAFAVRCVRD